MKELLTKALSWMEALQSDIEVGAIEYEDGTTWEPKYVEELERDIQEVKEAIAKL